MAFLAAALLGLCVGSFLNTCIYRLPRGLSVVRPRSRCPRCGQALNAVDLLPVAGYLIRRGRCRHCGAPVDLSYPLVELGGAALAAAALWWEGPSVAFVRTFALGCVFWAILVVDLKHRLIPNPLVAFGLAIAFAGAPWVREPSLAQAAWGCLAGGGSFALLRWAYGRVRGREGMGLGDVKLAALMGAALGMGGWLLAVWLASVAGVAVGVWFIARGKGSWQSSLPFGAFLAGAAIVVLFHIAPAWLFEF